MAKEVICNCDFCGSKIDTSESMTYKEFISWIYGAELFDAQPHRIREDVDLCPNCKKKIYTVVEFIKEIRLNK